MRTLTLEFRQLIVQMERVNTNSELTSVWPSLIRLLSYSPIQFHTVSLAHMGKWYAFVAAAATAYPIRYMHMVYSLQRHTNAINKSRNHVHTFTRIAHTQIHKVPAFAQRWHHGTVSIRSYVLNLLQLVDASGYAHTAVAANRFSWCASRRDQDRTGSFYRIFIKKKKL